MRAQTAQHRFLTRQRVPGLLWPHDFLKLANCIKETDPANWTLALCAWTVRDVRIGRRFLRFWRRRQSGAVNYSAADFFHTPAGLTLLLALSLRGTRPQVGLYRHKFPCVCRLSDGEAHRLYWALCKCLPGPVPLPAPKGRLSVAFPLGAFWK